MRAASARVVSAAGVIGDSLAQRQVVPDAFNRAATAVATVVKNREVFGMGGAGGTTQLTPVAPVVHRAPAPIAPAAVPSWETSLPVVGTLPTMPTLTPVAPVVQRAPAPVSPPLVPANVPPIVTTAPPATSALVPYTGGPIVTTAPTSSRPAMSAILDTRPIGGGAPISLSPPGGIRGAIGTVVGTAISRGVDWATRQITGSGGSRAPAIPSGGGSMPGVGEMGIGSTVGRIGGAVGAGIGAVGGMIAKGRKSKKWEKVIDAATGVAVWLLIDQATGAILGRRDKPPVRHMNVLNVRALRRADRRMDGFRKVARKVLSSQGFKVERRGTGRSCAPKRKRSC